MKGVITGLPTGFSDLDKMTSGLQAGDLVIIAGRPSMGKTVFGVNIAEHAAIQTKKPVVIFSLEMPSEMIVMRMLSSLGRINQQRLRTGQLNEDDWPRLTSAMSMLSDVPIFIDDQPGLSPNEIKSRLRRIAKQHGEIGLVLVDYLPCELVCAADHGTPRLSCVKEGVLINLFGARVMDDIASLNPFILALEPSVDPKRLDPDDLFLCFTHRP